MGSEKVLSQQWAYGAIQHVSPDSNSAGPEPIGAEVQATHIPSRPPPKKKFPFKLLLICGALGLLALFAKPYLVSNRPAGKAGPVYTSGDLTWQSLDPTWSIMYDEYALDMKVNPILVGTSGKSTFTITGELLRSLCGSVLTKLPAPPEGVTRNDIYRLGFRFFEVEDGTPTDIFPVKVQDGTCRAFDEQLVFDWSYPGPLTGWSPVQYNKTDKGLTFTFGRRGNTKVPFEQVDLKLACDALFHESSDKVKEMLKETDTINIRVVKGLVSGIAWIGRYKIQQFKVIDDSCFADGEVLDG
jgi:hypothetical protein